MKYYIIAGEASGDLHGSNLIKGIIKKEPDAKIRAWGGDLMQRAGATLVKHYKETAIMGFIEVLTNIGKIMKNLDLCKKDILNYNPDVVILIDYPGFNFRIAEFAKKRGFKVFYYIAPKVWAWKESRVHKLQKYVDKLFIIFPFEIDYFKKWGIEAVYRGNPLLDSIGNYPHLNESREDFAKRTDKKKITISSTGKQTKAIIAALAGSRKTEISYLLPIIVRTAVLMPEYRFILASAPSIEPEYYNKIIKEELNKCLNSTKEEVNIKEPDRRIENSHEQTEKNEQCIEKICNLDIISGETYSVILNADAAVISSGTASLETALLGTPQVVCYGGNAISFAIARHFVKLKYISLANLILDKQIFKELLQYECTPYNIAREIKMLLHNENYRNTMISDYDNVRKALGGEGASVRIADAIIEELNKTKDNVNTCI